MFNYCEEKMNINDLIEKLRNQGMIYVIGHSNIDIDSAVSSKIFSEILNKFWYYSYLCYIRRKI